MPTPLPELIASRFVIPGPDGRPRIEIGLVDGEPAIRLFGRDGEVMVFLGLEYDEDQQPEHAGSVAELRLAAGAEGGEAVLTAAHGSYAGMSISSIRQDSGTVGAGTWIEAKDDRLEGSFHGPSDGTSWSLCRGEYCARPIGCRGQVD